MATTNATAAWLATEILVAYRALTGVTPASVTLQLSVGGYQRAQPGERYAGPVSADHVVVDLDRAEFLTTAHDAAAWARWARDRAREAAESHGYEWWPPTGPTDPSKPYRPTMRHVGREVCSGRERMVC